MMSLLSFPVLALSLGLQAPAQDDLTLAANRALALEASQVLPVLLDGTLEASLRATLVLDGAPLELDLAPHSVRAEHFQVLVQTDDGSWISHDPGPVRTFRGGVSELPGAEVAATLFDEGLYARLRLPTGEEYWLQPLAAVVPGATLDQHVLYAADDVLPVGHGCGTDQLSGPFSSVQLTGGGLAGPAAIQVAELGCDADYEYFLDHGANTSARIESVINTMNLQYEAEVGITHQISTILVRSSSNQPYTSTDAGTLLNQFRNEWNANQGGVQRDVAQLFTGKEVNGGTIGIAWLGVVCNLSYGYGVVQSDFNNNFSCATDLSAHELGHNWNADHCSCTSNTMNPFITCANTFHTSLTIPEIANFRDSRTCLDGDGGGGDPTDVHVGSITGTNVGLGKGQKGARVTVVIRDDLGGLVSGALVQVTFTGDVSETRTGTTGADGSVTIDSLGTKKGRFRWDACVDDVTASLPYDPADNNQTCR